MRFMTVEFKNVESVLSDSNPQNVVRKAYQTYGFLSVSEIVCSPDSCVLSVAQGLDGMICMVNESDYYTNSLDPIGACRQRCGINGKLKEVERLCGLLVFVYGS